MKNLQDAGVDNVFFPGEAAVRISMRAMYLVAFGEKFTPTYSHSMSVNFPFQGKFQP
jgi:hypothetical protein